uniref:Uncharacterized protein n=1 Tax=Escherichia coli TaxID=562 RepID=A0A1B2RBS6_ECOLX|nr:hypothetical protein [Escherichia coli]
MDIARGRAFGFIFQRAPTKTIQSCARSKNIVDALATFRL